MLNPSRLAGTDIYKRYHHCSMSHHSDMDLASKVLKLRKAQSNNCFYKRSIQMNDWSTWYNCCGSCQWNEWWFASLTRIEWRTLTVWNISVHATCTTRYTVSNRTYYWNISNMRFYANIHNKNKAISTIHIDITIFSCPSIFTVTVCNQGFTYLQTSTMCAAWIWITWTCYFREKKRKHRFTFISIYCLRNWTYSLLFDSFFRSNLLHIYI
jgi:hypothetical protein